MIETVRNLYPIVSYPHRRSAATFGRETTARRLDFYFLGHGVDTAGKTSISSWDRRASPPQPCSWLLRSDSDRKARLQPLTRQTNHRAPWTSRVLIIRVGCWRATRTGAGVLARRRAELRVCSRLGRELMSSDDVSLQDSSSVDSSLEVPESSECIRAGRLSVSDASHCSSWAGPGAGPGSSVESSCWADSSEDESRVGMSS